MSAATAERRVGVRALPPSEDRIALRAAEEDGEPPILFGHFARFNEWTEVDSWIEGHFMERIAPTAFDKTFREGRDRIRVLFQHGRDPELGMKPIAEPLVMKRDGDVGAYYEARLFDGVPQIIRDGLEAKQYGASFKMEVLREEIVDEPEPSESNPAGIRECTIKEIRLHEFGPVTWGQYESATANLRSLTDDVIFDAIKREPSRFRALMGAHDLGRRVLTPGEQQEDQDNAPDRDDAARSRTSSPSRRDSALTFTTGERHSALRV
jgi:phage head maturation protease